MREQPDPPSPLYPIRTVARLTGVNPVTLRAWQRRHGLIQPRRTAKGHRLYSEADIALIRRILVLLEQGIAISQVGPLLRGEDGLRTLPWEVLQARVEAAARRLDHAILDALFHELMGRHDAHRMVTALLDPVLARLADNTPAAAFFRFFLRTRLAAGPQPIKGTAAGPHLLATAWSGGGAGLDLLRLGLTAQSHGCRFTPLEGMHDPAQLAAACTAADCDGILLVVDARVQLDPNLGTALAATGHRVFLYGPADTRLPGTATLPACAATAASALAAAFGARQIDASDTKP